MPPPGKKTSRAKHVPTAVGINGLPLHLNICPTLPPYNFSPQNVDALATLPLGRSAFVRRLLTWLDACGAHLHLVALADGKSRARRIRRDSAVRWQANLMAKQITRRAACTRADVRACYSYRDVLLRHTAVLGAAATYVLNGRATQMNATCALIPSSILPISPSSRRTSCLLYRSTCLFLLPTVTGRFARAIDTGFR